VKILFFTNLTFCRTKFHPFFWPGLASGQRDALQACSSSRQEWPASVPACAAADSTAASNIPPDSTDATAKHRPCLVRQRTAFSHSEVPVILQSDSFSAKIKKNGCRPRRAFLVLNVLVSTLLVVIFLVVTRWLGEQPVSTGDM